MPDSVNCPSCRSSIDVPADHVDPSIRCGICWAEVPLPTRPAPLAATATSPASPVAPLAARPLPPLPPGPAVPGMAKLEERLQRAAARLVPAPVPAKPILATPVVKPAAPLVEIQPALVTVAPARVDALVTPIPERGPRSPRDSDDVIDSDSRGPRKSRPTEPREREPRNRDRRRDDDDDDDDDRRPARRSRRAANQKGKSALPLFIGIGVFLVFLVGGAYLLARATRGKSDRDPIPVAGDEDLAKQFNLPNPDGNPAGPAPAPRNVGFNPFPKLPNMQPPAAALTLVAHAGDGYTAKVFERPSEHPSILNLYDDAFIIAHARTKFLRCTSTPPAGTIEITTAEVPQGVTPDLKRIATESVVRRGEVNPVKLAGHDGFESVDDFAGRTITTRVTQVGCRVFVLKFTITDAFGNRAAAEAIRKEFFDSFKITFDATTPAPVDPSLVPRRPIRQPQIPAPPRPKLPGQP